MNKMKAKIVIGFQLGMYYSITEAEDKHGFCVIWPSWWTMLTVFVYNAMNSVTYAMFVYISRKLNWIDKTVDFTITYD